MGGVCEFQPIIDKFRRMPKQVVSHVVNIPKCTGRDSLIDADVMTDIDGYRSLRTQIQVRFVNFAHILTQNALSLTLKLIDREIDVLEVSSCVAVNVT